MRLFIESDFAGAGRAMRLRHAFLQTQALRRRPDMVHVLGSGGRPHRDRLRRPERHLAFPAAAVPLDAERPWFTLPVGFGRRESGAGSHRRQGVNYTPDFVARLRFEPGRKRGLLLYTGHLQASVLVRQLRGEVPGESEAALVTGGIGGTVSGVLVPRWDADDRIKFAVNGGSGIGRYIADLSSLGGQDAVYDPVQVRLRALPVASGYVGYEHAWSRVFTTAVTYGMVNISNLDIQPEDAFHQTQRGSINSDVESGAVRGYRRRVPGRHAHQQEWPARLRESDSERLDAQVLTAAVQPRGSQTSRGTVPCRTPPGSKRLGSTQRSSAPSSPRRSASPNTGEACRRASGNSNGNRPRWRERWSTAC